MRNFVPDEMLEPEQLQAIEYIKGWIQNRDKRLVRIGGRAGTGKTTIIKKVIPLLDGPFAVAAYTGKATSQLRKKGVASAQTLHSLLYHVDDSASKVGKPSFRKKEALFVDYIIIDEGSMVGTSILKDIASFPHVRVIVFGDHWQLEPLDDDMNLMEDPDFVLEKIHRQAADSKVLGFAERCYRGTERFPRYDFPDLKVRSAADFWSVLKDVDQCIVGFNKTRHQVNGILRGLQGFKHDYPGEGEKIIFLQNNQDYGVYNGLVGTVTRLRTISDEVVSVDMEDEIGNKWYDLPTFRRQYGIDSLARLFKTELLFADYGHCLTGHKSQGSEWERGAILEELTPKWNSCRWRYTTITRFRNLIYCR